MAVEAGVDSIEHGLLQGLAWTALGLGLLWLSSGTVMGSLDDMRGMLDGNPLYAAVLGSDIVNGFLSLLALLAALGGTSWGIASIGRLRSEESTGRVEAVLATRVSRARWLGGQLAITVFGAALLVLSGAWLLWLGTEASGAADLPGAGPLIGLGAS